MTLQQEGTQFIVLLGMPKLENFYQKHYSCNSRNYFLVMIKFVIQYANPRRFQKDILELIDIYIDIYIFKPPVL